MLLPNGIHILESPYVGGNDIEICILNQGAIIDHYHDVVGIQHLIEHKTFTINNIDMYPNASTSINNMCFYISDVKDVKSLIKMLQMWFCKTPRGIKLAHNCNTIDIQRCIYEIDNEYTYRSTSYDLHDLLYFILMREVSMFFCGNKNTFTNVTRIKQIIDKLDYIQPEDIIVLYQSSISDMTPEIEKFFSQFPSYKSKIPKITLDLTDYYGKIIESDTSMYQIMFKLDSKYIEDLIYLPVLIHNTYLTIHSYLDGCYVKFFFDTNQIFQDFLYLIDTKRFFDLIPYQMYIDQETYFNFIRAGLVDNLYLSTTDFMAIANPKIEHIFNKIHMLYKKREFTVLGPNSDFIHMGKTVSGEPVRIEDFVIDFTKYIYDHSYKRYMMNFVDASSKWCKEPKPSFCFYPSLECKKDFNVPQKDTTLEETIRYLIQNILRAAPLNYELNNKQQDNKMTVNEKFDIHFHGNMATIKTKYDFTLFLLKLTKSANDFYLFLHTYLYQQKDLGNIYYFKVHFIKFPEYTIMTLFSNPSDFNKWKNSMIGFFASFDFNSYYLIQSVKSHVYDLSNLEKTTVVSF